MYRFFSLISVAMDSVHKKKNPGTKVRDDTNTDCKIIPKPDSSHFCPNKLFITSSMVCKLVLEEYLGRQQKNLEKKYYNGKSAFISPN
jgi:hypothetical protein